MARRGEARVQGIDLVWSRPVGGGRSRASGPKVENRPTTTRSALARRAPGTGHEGVQPEWLPDAHGGQCLEGEPTRHEAPAESCPSSGAAVRGARAPGPGLRSGK